MLSCPVRRIRTVHLDDSALKVAKSLNGLQHLSYRALDAGVMPKRESIEVVFGHPITCPQADSPTQAQIDEYHLRYVTALKDLYELHRR